MAIEIRISNTIVGGSVPINPPPVIRSGSSAIGIIEALPVSQAGSLTTRTDDNTGEITMSSGDHSISTGDVVDIYWASGVHRGATVGTVDGTAVPIDSGIGDDLPIQGMGISIVPQFAINTHIDGDNLKMIAILLETPDPLFRTAGHVQFRDASAGQIAEIDLVANIPKIYDIEGGSDNPFTGNAITSLRASCAAGAATAFGTLKISGVQDGSP
jgi:hypothetical protein